MYRHVGQVMAGLRDSQGTTHWRYLLQIRLAQLGHLFKNVYPIVFESGISPILKSGHHGEVPDENSAASSVAFTSELSSRTGALKKWSIFTISRTLP